MTYHYTREVRHYPLCVPKRNKGNNEPNISVHEQEPEITHGPDETWCLEWNNKQTVEIHEWQSNLKVLVWDKIFLHETTKLTSGNQERSSQEQALIRKQSRLETTRRRHVDQILEYLSQDIETAPKLQTVDPPYRRHVRVMHVNPGTK